jgi:hypothetical protein
MPIPDNMSSRNVIPLFAKEVLLGTSPTCVHQEDQESINEKEAGA